MDARAQRDEASAAEAVADEAFRAGAPVDTIKGTLISLLIAFILTLAFRAFIVEAFVIPTGSMGPTLLGRHMRFRSPQTGFDWAVNPWQGLRGDEPVVNAVDPSSRLVLEMPSAETLAGDRILVLKTVDFLRPYRRWDVVVFKNPERPVENYIKRLVGLPGESVWLVDGDVFIAEPASTDPVRTAWRIQRKPRALQETLWWTLFSSEFAPLDAAHVGVAWVGPWRAPEGDAWDLAGREYRCESAGPTALAWDSSVWPIDDWAPYNDAADTRLRAQRSPVSDLRLRCAVTPDRAGMTVAGEIEARGRTFRAEIGPGGARLLERRAPRRDPGETPPVEFEEGRGEWAVLASAPSPRGALAPGSPTRFEFTHVDQSLSLMVNGREVLRHEYDWAPMERLAAAMAMREEDVASLLATRLGNPLAEPSDFLRPGVSLRFDGGPFTAARVGLDRDLHYRADEHLGGPRHGRPALATHPAALPTLTPEQFYVLGDNSAASKDSRLWDTVDPWVAEEIDGTVGVVPRRMMLGRAFFVYFPAPHEVRVGSRTLRVVPDFGRMRVIR